ncbi:hypothetical protein [Sphingomonas sp. ERG5]|uniref:hypothetical protein n=1 Tax=Sphingomonas sp. ERG5 TaxID=1381597 RepID=UPI00054C163A|nr:hypothetical protein [Sphingomonas sp. ERG5]
MKARVLLLGLLLASCAHPEDRRWANLIPPPGTAPADAVPNVSVYAFPTPADPKPVTKLRDLSGEGQAAYIDKISTAADAGALRRALAAPIARPAGLGATERPSLDETVVIGVQKQRLAAIGDRVMRTVVTIVPTRGSFEFAGYTVIATDNQVQSIAHLETTSEASLDASLAPPIKGFGDNSIAGKLSRSVTTSADISAQYEKLNVDIGPDKIVITRESERGLDVIGNTIIKLSLIPTPPAGMGSAGNVFLVGDQDLFKDGAVLKPGDASLDIDTFAFPARCPLTADVSMDYRVRRVVRGAKYYTEGKQDAQVLDGQTPASTVELVRARDVTIPLWRIVIGDNQTAITVRRADNTSRFLAFNNYEAAQAFALWLRKTGATRIGKDGVVISSGGRPTLNADVHAAAYSIGCGGAPETP